MPITPYNEIKKTMLNSLNAGIWRNSISKQEKGIWSDYVGRRLLHYFMLKIGCADAINSVRVNSDQQTKLLYAIRQSALSLKNKPVQVDADLNTLSNSDWLELELKLLHEQLQQGLTRPVYGPDLLEKARPDSFVPAVIRKFTPWYVKSFTLVNVVSIIGLTLISLLPVEAMIAIVPGAVVSWGLILDFEQAGIKNKFESLALANLSTSWDDVFQMKTEEDAILLGMIAGTIHVVQASFPDIEIPDFLSLSPATAYRIVSRTLNEDGCFDIDNAKALFLAATTLPKMEVEASHRNIIQGVDLSMLQAPKS